MKASIEELPSGLSQFRGTLDLGDIEDVRELAGRLLDLPEKGFYSDIQQRQHDER
jgi:hypothetical protein